MKRYETVGKADKDSSACRLTGKQRRQQKTRWYGKVTFSTKVLPFPFLREIVFL